MASETLQDRITSLYRLHPRDFVAARNELAADVKRDDPSQAKNIRKLRKPTLAAWGLNLTSQDEPEQIGELRSAGAELRRAQASAVGGGDGDDELRAAERNRRKLVRALTDAAVERAGENQRDRIEATLERASVDEAVGDELSTGRMTKQRRRPSGVGDLATMLSVGSSRRPRSNRKETKQLKRRLKKIDAVRDRHRDELRRAQDRLADARETVKSAERRVREDEEERTEIERRLERTG